MAMIILGALCMNISAPVWYKTQYTDPPLREIDLQLQPGETDFLRAARIIKHLHTANDSRIPGGLLYYNVILYKINCIIIYYVLLFHKTSPMTKNLIDQANILIYTSYIHLNLDLFMLYLTKYLPILLTICLYNCIL